MLVASAEASSAQVNTHCHKYATSLLKFCARTHFANLIIRHIYTHICCKEVLTLTLSAYRFHFYMHFKFRPFERCITLQAGVLLGISDFIHNGFNTPKYVDQHDQ